VRGLESHRSVSSLSRKEPKNISGIQYTLEVSHTSSGEWPPDEL
jgi:hypothetical protein